MKNYIVFIFILYIALYQNTFAKKFFVDPSKGKINNTGTINSPWNTLQEVIEKNKIESYEWSEKPQTSSSALIIKNAGAPVKSSDTIVLLNGYHGKIQINGYFNSSYITIMAYEGHNPQISYLYVLGGEKWRFSGLSISSEFENTFSDHSLVRFESHNWNGKASKLILERCKVYSVANASIWTKDQWNEFSQDGIIVSAEECMLKYNYFKNVNFAIFIIGNKNTIRGNIIENFSGDGLTGCANDLIFEYNIVKNCYKVNNNHDDGFQSYSINGDPPRERIVLRGNTFINNVSANQPFQGSLQGIGCFDGFYIDWIVENNIVITNNVHGITFLGAKNCRIVNNTVLCSVNSLEVPTRINITKHKDGTPSENCLIRNNLTTGLVNGDGVSKDHNLIVSFSSYSNHFIDYKAFNFDLKSTSTAVDKGINDLAPVTDIKKRPRPYGNGIDLGAYEYVLDNTGITDTTDTTHVIDTNIIDTNKIDTSQNQIIVYPNPFSSFTSIFYKIKDYSKVSLEMYDLNGKRMATLLSDFLYPGEYVYYLKPEEFRFETGIYICAFSCNGNIEGIKLFYL